MTQQIYKFDTLKAANKDLDSLIPIEMFFEWGQDRDFENYLVPMLSKYF